MLSVSNQEFRIIVLSSQFLSQRLGMAGLIGDYYHYQSAAQRDNIDKIGDPILTERLAVYYF